MKNNSTSQTSAEAPSPGVGSSDLLAVNVARFMAYAYHRGRLDSAGMPDCAEKEHIIKRCGNEDAPKWVKSAEVLLSANGSSELTARQTLKQK